MNKLTVVEMNGQQTIDSRLVAEALQMQHKHLLEKVRNYEDILTGRDFDPLTFFIPSSYQDTKGQTRNCYMLTKKGCEMVANKLTGEKGVLFTAMYVEVFNQMEKQVLKLPTDPRELLILTIQAHENTAKRVDAIENDVKNLKENKLLDPGEYNYLSKAVKNRVKVIKEIRQMSLNSTQNSKLYSAINHDLNTYVGIKTRTQIRQKDFEKALDFVNNWEPSYTDLRIIEQLALDV